MNNDKILNQLRGEILDHLVVKGTPTQDSITFYFKSGLVVAMTGIYSRPHEWAGIEKIEGDWDNIAAYPLLRLEEEIDTKGVYADEDQLTRFFYHCYTFITTQGIVKVKWKAFGLSSEAPELTIVKLYDGKMRILENSKFRNSKDNITLRHEDFEYNAKTDLLYKDDWSPSEGNWPIRFSLNELEQKIKAASEFLEDCKKLHTTK